MTQITLILDQKKAALLTTTIHLLKACSEQTAFIMRPDHVHIQVMDKSHVCLCECRLYYSWFAPGTTGALESTTDAPIFVFASATFHSILASITSDQQRLQAIFDTNADTFTVDVLHAVTNKENINKHYTLPLVGTEAEIMDIADNEYIAEFSIGVKTIADIFAQMLLFGVGVNVRCTEEAVHISSAGDVHKGAVEVAINTNDFEEYAIDEGADFVTQYSLTLLTKLCITTKLVPEVKFFISDTMPMKILYALGGDNDAQSIVQFFLAPKIGDLNDD